MDEPFEGEYRRANMSDPLRQGDILESTDRDATMWERHLFVITADCDFAHAKHQGRVTCIPLLSDNEYLIELQIPRIRERVVRTHLKTLQKLLEKPGLPAISIARLRTWSSEEPPEVIASDRLKLNETDSEAATAAFKALRILNNPAGGLKEQFNQLIEAQQLGPNPQKHDNTVKALKTELQQTYTKTPGDALFLSRIAPGYTSGYFAYLRHIEQVDEPEIALGPGRKTAQYRRVSHLRDRFTHALVQRFAMVFMTIGLPNDYEEMRDFYAENLGAQLT